MAREKLSEAAYAAHRGVSQQSISKARKSGRLKKSVSKDRAGKFVYDVELADAEWDATTHPARGGKVSPGVLPPVGETEPARPAPAPDAKVPDGHQFRPLEINDKNSKAQLLIALAEEKRARARLAEMEYQVKTGELIAAAHVRKDAFAVARQVRDAMLNIPARVAADLAVETDAFEIDRKLSAEIRSALNALADLLETSTDGA